MSNLSDIEIREILKRHGEDIGPITATTRNIYLRKIDSIQKANNKTLKAPRKSDLISNDKPPVIPTQDKQYSKIYPHIDKNNDVTNGNIEPKVNKPSINFSHTKSLGQTLNSNYRTNISRYDHDSSTDSDFQKLAKENQHREFMNKNLSPVHYGTDSFSSTYRNGKDNVSSKSITSNDRFNEYKQMNSSAKPNARAHFFNQQQFDESNTSNSEMNDNFKKWYKGSLGTMSNYLTNWRFQASNKDHDDLVMDISDADVSDNEDTNLISRLRRNYFKKSSDTGSSCSPTKPNRRPLESSFVNWNHLPNLLLFSIFIFSIVLFSTYLIKKNQYSHGEVDVVIDGMICKAGENKGCFSVSDMSQLKRYLSRLYEVLSEHSGTQTCQFNKNKHIPFSKAKEKLNNKLRREQADMISESYWNKLMQLLIQLPRDKLDIIGYNNDLVPVDIHGLPEDITYLEGTKPKLPMGCRLKLAVFYVFSWITYIIGVIALCVVMLIGLYFLNCYRLKRREMYERHISELRDVVTSISDLLQVQIRQSEYSPFIEKFMPLSKIRSILMVTYPKLRDNKFWDQVKKFMYKTEPLIELKETMAQGEILQWRCQPGWQGSAVQSECQVKFEKGPTECLKIRNMDLPQFDENGQNYLRREVLNRIKNAGEVKDIQFLTKGPKVIVYVMCASREVAGKAFRKINANYFNGNLLNVKFIRLDKYLERFPESKIYV